MTLELLTQFGMFEKSPENAVFSDLHRLPSSPLTRKRRFEPQRGRDQMKGQREEETEADDDREIPNNRLLKRLRPHDSLWSQWCPRLQPVLQRRLASQVKTPTSAACAAVSAAEAATKIPACPILGETVEGIVKIFVVNHVVSSQEPQLHRGVPRVQPQHPRVGELGRLRRLQERGWQRSQRTCEEDVMRPTGTVQSQE